LPSFRVIYSGIEGSIRERIFPIQSGETLILPLYTFPYFCSLCIFCDTVSIMKSIAFLLALAGAASAHYTFPALIYGGTTSADWEYVRDWTGSYTYDPVTDVTSTDIRCNVDGDKNFASSTLSVAAGQNIGFTVDRESAIRQHCCGLGRLWYSVVQDIPGRADGGRLGA
jgi:hypothetical protein